MARKKIARKIVSYPKDNLFKPGACEGQQSVALMVEELEAMRLKDVEELSQQDAAERMGISRQTFQNIIDSGRKKVASALFEGMCIEIVGGNHVLADCYMKCTSCDEVYEVAYIDDKHICPECGCDRVTCTREEVDCTEWCVEHSC